MPANDSLKLNNPINNCSITLNIILYHAFSPNIFEYLKYNQHQHYHNQLKNHRHIRITQSYLYYQLKNLFKHCQKIIEIYFRNDGNNGIYFRDFCFDFSYFNTNKKHITIHSNVIQT